MDRSSSRQLKDVTAWLVRNESRSRRLTASSRDGQRRTLRAGSHQREDRIDDVTVPEWAVAFPAAGELPATQGDGPSHPGGHNTLRDCGLSKRIRGNSVAAGRLLTCYCR